MEVKRRVIRARLCVRGFKDCDAGQLPSYASTASRFAQRVIVSETVEHDWELCTTDINKAFLQGVDYKELAKMTGEPEREVNFTLPIGSAALLKRLPGFENFDVTNEVLHCDKPGTGLVDAPRAFSIKLSQITRKLGLEPSSIDNELVLKHEGGQLVLMLTKHVDDLKIAGRRALILSVIAELEKTFGKLKLE